VVNACPNRSTLGNDPVTAIQEDGWAPGPVWTGAENLTTTGLRIPDRSTRSETLYRLSYPGPRNKERLHPDTVSTDLAARLRIGMYCVKVELNV
jgi:hypothetical protein